MAVSYVHHRNFNIYMYRHLVENNAAGVSLYFNERCRDEIIQSETFSQSRGNVAKMSHVQIGCNQVSWIYGLL